MLVLYFKSSISTYSAYKFSIKYMIYKYFPHSKTCLFIHLIVLFNEQKILILSSPVYHSFPFMDHVFMSCNTSWHCTRSQRFSPIFNCRSFRNLCIAVRTMIYYELNFEYSSLFYIWISKCSITICWKLYSLCTEFSLHLCEKLAVHICIGLFLGFLFCFINMFVYLVLIVKSCNQVVVLWICLSVSELSLYSSWILFTNEF